MLSKYKLNMPARFKYIWDTLAMSKHTPETKVTQGMAKEGVRAPAGNANHSLPEVYKAVTGQEIENHHRAGDDAKTNVPIATYPPFWERRTNKSGGLIMTQGVLEDKEEGIERAARSKCLGFF
jgi:hypothetical protein